MVLWLVLVGMLASCAGAAGSEPTVTVRVTEPTAAFVETEPPAESSAVPTLRPTPTTTTEPDDPEEASPPTATALSGEPVELTTYALVAEESKASFRLRETLAGRPNTVIGTTRSLAGSFRLNLRAPAATEYDPIQIQADSFVTDDDRRNGAIRRFILQTGRAGNETIVFQPLSALGLPPEAEIGESYPLTLSGDLTIHGVTQPATFEGEVGVVSADRLEGCFETVIERADFGLSIPRVPLVADVDERVQLRLDFVAVAQ